jgi:hypothetical protein
MSFHQAGIARNNSDHIIERMRGLTMGDGCSGRRLSFSILASEDEIGVEVAVVIQGVAAHASTLVSRL